MRRRRSSALAQVRQVRGPLPTASEPPYHGGLSTPFGNLDAWPWRGTCLQAVPRRSRNT